MAMLFMVLTLWCSAFAAIITVTSSADNGVGTLRSALTNATDGDEIRFLLPENDNTITLSTALEFSASRFSTGISINGSNEGRGVILDGGSTTGILNIKAGNVVRIKSLTFRNGYAANGGAVFSYGNVFVENCAFYANKATAYGGAVSVHGTDDGKIALALVRCTFSENTASIAGGGVYFARPARIYMCSFIGNNGGSGGGIKSACNNHLIANCSILNNKGIEGAGLSMYTGSWTGRDRVCYSTLAFNNSSPSSSYASYDVCQYYQVLGGAVLCGNFGNPSGSEIGTAYVESGIVWSEALSSKSGYGAAIDSAVVDGVTQMAPRPVQGGLALGYGGGIMWHNADWSVYSSVSTTEATICEDIDVLGHKINSFPFLGSQFVDPVVQIDEKTVVPYSWLRTYYPTLPQIVPGTPIRIGSKKFHAAYSDASTNDSSNVSSPRAGTFLKNWESYVAGLNPTNSTDALLAYINMVNDNTPVITWTPNLNTNGVVRKYTIEGSESIQETSWHSPTNSYDRFYRVRVEMPE